MNGNLCDPLGVNENELRAELGKQVRRDRRRLYGTVAAAVDDAPKDAKVSRGTWEKAESGTKIRDYSWAAIEKRLGWPGGYADDFLTGLSAERRAAHADLREALRREREAVDVARAATASDALSDASNEDLIAELRRRLTETGGERNDSSAAITVPEVGPAKQPTEPPLSEVDDELPAAAKEGAVEESGEFNT